MAALPDAIMVILAAQPVLPKLLSNQPLRHQPIFKRATIYRLQCIYSFWTFIRGDDSFEDNKGHRDLPFAALVTFPILCVRRGVNDALNENAARLNLLIPSVILLGKFFQFDTTNFRCRYG